MRLLSGVFIVGAILASATAAGAQDIDWQKVDGTFGRKAAVWPMSIDMAFPEARPNGDA
jgi:hypothetical protein